MTAVVGDAPAQAPQDSRRESLQSAPIAYRPVDSVAAPVAVVLVLATAIVCGTGAVLGADNSVSLRWVLPAAGALIAWAGVFAHYVRRSGISPRLVLVHVGIVALMLLMQRQLVPASTMVEGSSWLMPITTATLIISQVAFRPPRGPAVGSFVIVCYVVGLLLAVPPTPAMVFGTLTLAIQLALVTWLVSLLRRSDRDALASLQRRVEVEVVATVEATRRADERRLSLQLHDHGLTTLLMVGLGTIATGSATLRDQAMKDLQVFEKLASETAELVEATCRLDDVLRETIRTAGLPIEVQIELPAIVTTTVAATHVVSCVAEALRNVARHAGAPAAIVRAWQSARDNVVEVADSGRGFDPDLVPAGRRGIRESIVGRMAAFGGRATVMSAPGHGTRVRLEWNR